MLKRVLALFCLLYTAAAAGQDRPGNWYLLLGAGASQTKAAQDRAANDAALTAQGFGLMSSREETGATSLAIGAGYRFIPNLALELSFLDFSQLHYYSSVYATGPNFGSLSKQWQASGIETAAVVTWPVNDSFSIIGKAGVLSLKGKYRTTTMVTQPNGVVVSSSESSASGSATVPGFGLGVAYTFDTRMSVRAVYEGWGTKSGSFGPGNDLDTIRQLSFGMLFRL